MKFGSGEVKSVRECDVREDGVLDCGWKGCTVEYDCSL